MVILFLDICSHLSLIRFLSADMEEDWLMTFTAASHQGAIKMICLYLVVHVYKQSVFCRDTSVSRLVEYEYKC